MRRGVPVGVNPQIIEQADKAVTQRNQPLLGCGRGGGTDAAVGIDHLPQVVAQEFEHGEVALLAGRFSVLLDAHDGAHDLPAQAVVQVLRQLQTLLQVGVVQGQGVLLGEGLAQVFAGAGDAGLQLLVGVQDALVHLLGRQQHEQQTGVGAVEVAAVQHLPYDKEVTQADQHQQCQRSSNPQVRSAPGAQGMDDHPDDVAKIDQQTATAHPLQNRPARGGQGNHRRPQGQRPQRLGMAAGDGLLQQVPNEDVERENVGDEGHMVGPGCGQRAGKGPGLREQQVAAKQQPTQRYQGVPAEQALLALRNPGPQRQQAQHGGDGEVDLKGGAHLPGAAFEGLLHVRRAAQPHHAQPWTEGGDAHHAHPDGVGIAGIAGIGTTTVQGRRRQQPRARGAPGAGQRLAQVQVAPEQVLVAIDRASDSDGIDGQGDGGRILAGNGGGNGPVDAVPDGAVIPRPAPRPIVRQGDVLPAVLRGVVGILHIGLRGLDTGDARGAVVRDGGGIGMGQATVAAQPQDQPQRQADSNPVHQSINPLARASVMARSRELTDSLR